MYEHGYYVEMDLPKASNYYIQSSAKCNVTASINLFNLSQKLLDALKYDVDNSDKLSEYYINCVNCLRVCDARQCKNINELKKRIVYLESQCNNQTLDSEKKCADISDFESEVLKISGIVTQYNDYVDKMGKISILAWLYITDNIEKFRQVIRYYLIHEKDFECEFLLDFVEPHKICSDIFLAEVVKYIKNINSQNKQGNTLLHIVAQCSCCRCQQYCKRLLAYGIDKNIKNCNGKTAYEICELYNGTNELKSLLITDEFKTLST
jgi:hypothetical protein